MAQYYLKPQPTRATNGCRRCCKRCSNWIGTEGRNVRIDIRWGENDVELDRRYATELLAFAPDVILASGTLSVAT
jgi:hypothetical protein